jgi:transposase
VDVDGHFYSVPYRHARAQVELRATLRTIEIFFEGDRIAVHRRGAGNGKHTTIADHMPSSHRRHKDWTIERIMQEAVAIGPSAELLCRLIFEGRSHPEQGVRSCRGIVSLARSFSAPRVEAACLRALEIGARAYGPVRSILDKKLDSLPARHLRGSTPQTEPEIKHGNIRGSRYYH